MTHDPANLAPAVPWVTRDAPPPGAWRWTTTHWPLPLAPLYADYALGHHLPAGFAAGRDALSVPTLPLSAIVVDGYGYLGFAEPYAAPLPAQAQAFERAIAVGLPETVLRGWPQRRRRTVAALRRGQVLPLAALPQPQLLAHLRRLSDLLANCYGDHFTNRPATSIVIGRVALRWAERLSLSDAEFVQLLGGASRATRAPAALLARLAVSVPNVEAALATGDPHHPAVRALLQRFLALHGDRAVDYDFVHPTLSERPERLPQFLREALTANPRRTQAPIPPELRARINRLPAPDRAAFTAGLRQARAAYYVRDDDIGMVLWGNGLMRHAVLEAGHRLASAGTLDRAEDVCFLHARQFEAALVGEPEPGLAQAAACARAEHQQQRGLTPVPSFVSAAPPPFVYQGLSPAAQAAAAGYAWYQRAGIGAGGAVESATPGRLKGQGASPGVYTGPVRVVASEADFDRVRPGDVLVCATTSPAWNIVFSRVKGLVTDVGGVLSHSAIVAREFGIPAVVGTRTATKTLSDGQQVTVDGVRGVVDVH